MIRHSSGAQVKCSTFRYAGNGSSLTEEEEEVDD